MRTKVLMVWLWPSIALADKVEIGPFKVETSTAVVAVIAVIAAMIFGIVWTLAKRSEANTINLKGDRNTVHFTQVKEHERGKVPAMEESRRSARRNTLRQ